MTNTTARAMHWRLTGVGVLLVAIAPAARAQSANCETFKERLAASLEAKGVHGFALEIVPRRTPVPSGARVVGSCDGGAYTVLYRRWAAAGSTTPAAESTGSSASGASAPESLPAVAVAASAPLTRAERRKAEREKAASAAAARAAAASEAAAKSAAQAATPAPAPGAAPAPASIMPPAPIAPLSAQPAASTAQVVAASTELPPVALSKAGAESPPSRFDDLARRIAWIVAAVIALVALVKGFRRWRHHRYYDESGLPRGPRMTL